MNRIGVLIAGMLGAVALPAGSALAQEAPASASAPATVALPLDPVRVEAARAVIGRIMPADRREAMVEQMIRPMMENMNAAMREAPTFKEARAKDPKLAAVVDAFMAEEFERTVTLTKQSLPEMMEAMAKAYARRFTLAQLKAIDAFFTTPAGRAYAEQASTIMADPDVLAAQRAMMARAMDGVQARAAALAARLAEQQESK